MFPKINKKRKSRNILIIAAAFFLLFAFVSVHSVHALSFPAGISNYVALNLSNSQSTATPNPFQQMINITSADNGWTYINTNQTTAFGQNVEFFYANGTVIPSWLENYTLGHAVWWVKTGSIAASSTLTIYMGFANKTTNLFNNKTTGESPQLSSTYAEYDDGADVFSYYQRWGGLSSLPTNWGEVTNSIVTFASTYTEIQPNQTTRGWYGIYLNPIPASLSSTTTVWEYYGNQYNDIAAGSYVGTSESTTGNFAGYSFSEGDTTTNLIYLGNNATQFDASAGYDDTNNNKIYTMAMASGTALDMQINYSSIYSTASAVAEAPTYFDIAVSNNGGSKPASPIYIYWLRTRAYPPNGVMPSVTFGSVQSTVAITLYLNGVSKANTTITYGTESNFTAERASSYISIYVNGTKVVSLPLVLKTITLFPNVEKP